MDTALFYRKCSNSKEYFKLANNYPYLGSKLHFIIEYTIILKQEEYDKFLNEFLHDNARIKKITNNLYMDDSDTIHCAFFTSDGNSGFLIYPSGYNYARYVAFYDLKSKS